MYPYELFLDITLYDILVMLGVIAAFAVFVLYAGKIKLPKPIRLLVLISAAVGVALGFAAAGLVQSIYFYIASEDGVFEWRGMTFYGGLVGGAAFFLGTYFLVGYLWFRKGETPNLHKEHAMQTFGIVICAVTIAHAIGRIGCLTAGCCHGETFEEARWYTLPIHRISTEGKLMYIEHVVPVPLYEMFFLLDLFALLSWRVLKKKGDALPMYMVLYGVWRFCIEYARADERGETFIKFLSPSQLTAVLMLIGGVVLFVLYYKVIKKRRFGHSERSEESRKENRDL